MMHTELRDYNFIYALSLAYGVDLEGMYYDIDVAADNLFGGTLDFYNNTMDILDSDTSINQRLDNINTINMRKLIDSYMNTSVLDSFSAGAPVDNANPFFQF